MKRKTIRNSIFAVLGAAVIAYVLIPKKYEAHGTTYVVGPTIWNVCQHGQTSTNTFFRYTSEFVRASVSNGVMSVNGLEYGRIDRGDRVRITPFGKVSVNGQIRKGRKPANQALDGTA